MHISYEGYKSVSQLSDLVKDYQTAAPIVLPPLGAMFHGDNLVCMASLLPNYEGKLDLIYTDPPFNTNLNFYCSPERTSHVSHTKTSQIAYSDKIAFNDYLGIIKERIYLMHLLLSERGTLYLHIDIKVGHYIKIILDEIFGINNFINEITRIKSNPKNFRRNAYGNQKDVIYVYAKNAGKNIFNNIKETPTQEELIRLYPKVDTFGRRFTTVPCHAPGETDNGATGGKWRGMLPPPGRHWRCAPEELEKLDRQGMIAWSTNNVPRIIKYADAYEGRKIQDVWLNYKDPPYPIYPTEKNMAMLELIVRQSSSADSIVMDCFCGSGSFLAAALRHGRRPIGIDRSDMAISVALNRPELRQLPLIRL